MKKNTKVLSVFSVSEECAAFTEEEARMFLQTPDGSENEMARLLDPKTCWQELDSIIRKIYLYPDLDARMKPFDKLYDSISYMPGGIRLFNVKVFENYQKESPKLREFFEKFEVHWQSKQPVKLEKFEKARNYAEMPLFPEEISRLENPGSSWKELDNIIKKIYPYFNVASYKKLVKAMEATPGGIQ
ncbi:MAG: hypothetical protein LBS28_00245 [Streptococcaceae bacterium]|jgi:hypothetical protein|nr:hypothetical protein [Streptococcaceae bacterium]